jgi:hypothetical protein
MVTKPTKVTVKGFSRLNTEGVSSQLDNSELRVLENMVWTGFNTIEKRKGVSLYKTNDQWTSANKVIAAIDFDLNDTGATELYALSDGRLFYTDSNTIPSTTAYTEIMDIEGASPALATNERVYFKVLNNRCFVTDGGYNIYYVEDDMSLNLVEDPDGYAFYMTVDAAIAVTVGDVYEDDDDTSRRFYIVSTKSTGTGTSIELRQTSGATRPNLAGLKNLSKVSGDAGSSANVPFTAITFVENYVALAIHEGRLVALSNLGAVYLSATNDGADMSGVDSTFFQYAKDDSLTVTNIVGFKRTSVITASNQELRRSSISTLTGYRRYDTDFSQLVDGVFKIQKESNFLGVVGRSGAEVGNSFIGLTKNGFISFASINSNNEFGIVDSGYISREIQQIINRINWTYSDKIIAAVDFDNQRYYCAAPVDASTEANVVFIYDFKHSNQKTSFTEASHKWSVASYVLDSSATISSMFTIRGKVFIGDSLGKIYETDYENTYTDNGNNYPSQFITKAFDLDNPDSTKHFDRISPHLLVSSTSPVDLQITTIVDENMLTKDFLGLAFSQVEATPHQLDIEDWSEEESDIWTTSPFDVWEYDFARELIVPLEDVPYEGRQIALRVRDLDGSTYWGATGISITATDYADYSDNR